MIFRLLVILSILFSVQVAMAADVCQDKNTVIYINTTKHKLWLCEKNKTLEKYSVALGKGGISKKKQGDNKTPLGKYTLGQPRPSEKFGIFIPINYPTANQIKQGYTGGAIGIHGPHRKFTWAGKLNTMVDWTQGCIAVASDEKIDSIANWVKQKKVREVYIQ